MLERLQLILNVYDQEALLVEILTLSSQKLLAYIGETSLPPQFEWIVIELAVQRFNRIGSEGMSSESVDGGSSTYIEDDLSPYYTYLNDYISTQNTGKGYKLF